MNKNEEAVAAAIFHQLRIEAAKVGAVDFLILKAAFSGKITYEEMPDRLRESLAAIGVAALLHVARR